MTQPRIQELEARARNIGSTLKQTLPKNVAFFLLLSNWGEGGMKTYVSSMEREGAIKLLREMADNLEEELRKE